MNDSTLWKIQMTKNELYDKQHELTANTIYCLEEILKEHEKEIQKMADEIDRLNQLLSEREES